MQDTVVKKPGSTRLRWLDFIRGIGMLLVIAGHAGVPEPYWTSIYTFHMPPFYMITGCCYRDCGMGLWGFTKKEFRKLCVPYLVFSFISLFITFAFPQVYGFPVSRAQLKQFLYGIAVARGAYDFTGSWGAIWFLISDFWLLLFVYLLNKGKLPAIAVGCIAGPIITYKNLIKMPYVNDHGWLIWSIGASLMAIPIFYLGTLYVKKLRKPVVSSKFSRILFSLLAVLLAVICLNYARHNRGIVAFTANYYGDLGYMLVGALGIPLGLITFSDCFYGMAPRLSENILMKAVEWIGRNTLMFLGTHGMILHFIQLQLAGRAWWQIYIVTLVLSSVMTFCWNVMKNNGKG